MHTEQIVNCYVKRQVNNGGYEMLKIGADAEFTGRIKYVKDEDNNVKIYVEIEYEDKKVEKLKRTRQPKTFSERLQAFLFNHTFEEEYENQYTKKVEHWIAESDIKIEVATIEVATIVDCNNKDSDRSESKYEQYLKLKLEELKLKLKLKDLKLKLKEKFGD